MGYNVSFVKIAPFHALSSPIYFVMDFFMLNSNYDY